MTDSTNADSQRTMPGGVTFDLSKLEQAIAPYAAHVVEEFLRGHGDHGGPLVSVTLTYEDNTVVMLGHEIQPVVRRLAVRAGLPETTPARSSLPPDFGKLIAGFERATRDDTDVLGESAYDCEDRPAFEKAKAALEAAISSLGQPSGDLTEERVMAIREKVARQLDDLCAYARAREVLGASEEGEAELRLIRAIASALEGNT